MSRRCNFCLVPHSSSFFIYKIKARNLKEGSHYANAHILNFICQNSGHLVLTHKGGALVGRQIAGLFCPFLLFSREPYNERVALICIQLNVPFKAVPIFNCCKFQWSKPNNWRRNRSCISSHKAYFERHKSPKIRRK